MGLWNLILERLVRVLAGVGGQRVTVGAGMATAAVCLLFAGCGPRADRGEGVQLIPSTSGIEPATAFEVRFDEPMVASAKVGETNAASPLEITPKLRGHFTWTSSRSGSFRPGEPLALGRVYRFTLRPGLVNAEGQPAKASLQRTVQPPPFGIADKALPAASSNAPARPTIKLWFNADVTPGGIAAQAGFVNAKGLLIPARVRQGKVTDNLGDWRDHPASWQAQFEEQQRKPEETLQDPVSGKETSQEAAVSNLLVIEPQQPLAAGRGWKLVIAKGYRSADGRHRGFSEFEAPIGDVQEFTLEDAWFTHVIHQQPCLRLLFSRSIPEALTNSHPEWVMIKPRPENLKAEVAGGSLSLSGSWHRETVYTVMVRPGLASTDGLVLGVGTSNQFLVPPVPPRIYFPAFSAEQFAGGNRQFTVQSVNIDRFKVRAKLLDAGNVIHALRGYGSYTRRPRYRLQANAEPEYDGELYRRVDYNVVPGRTVFEEEMRLRQLPDQGQETTLSWDRLLGGRKTGVVFLEAELPEADSQTGKRLGAQALIQVTDLGIAWKSGADSNSTHVFSQATGKAVPGAKVQLLSTENEPLREGTTDAGGTAAMASHTNATWLLVQKDDDLHAVRVDQHNLESWSFESIRSVYYGTGYDERRQRVALFMDRDVYRPGESAHLKLVARELTEAGLGVPLGMTGLVQCFDARSKRILETNIVLGDLGSFDMTIPLPREPRGEYQLRFESAGVSKFHSFSVADYEPAAFEVHLQAKDTYGPEERMEISVGGRYQFGKNLERATIRWYLNAADAGFGAAGFEAFKFGREVPDDLAPAASYFGKGEGKLAGPSNTVIQVDFPFNAVSPGPLAATFQVEITDVNQQTIGRSIRFLRDSSDFYLGLKRPEGVIEAGKPLEVEIAAAGRDGKAWSHPMPATLVLRRVDWESVLVQGAGNSVRYRHKAIMTNVWEKEIAVEPPIRKDSGGEATYVGTKYAGILAPGAGEYFLDVSSKDAGGRPVASSVRFYVTENTRTAWDYRNEYEIKLVPNRTVYHPGETAEILVKTPFGGDAWVTVEREGVRRQFVAHLEGNAPIVQVPIAAGDFPNVFVSVMVVRGAEQSPHQARTPEYRVGYCMLNVEDPATQLRVEAAAGQTNYLPGAEVTVTGSVRDATGKAVANAEVTLYAVDEGVLSLSGYVEPDLHSIFLARRGLGVQSGITLPFLLPEDASQLQFNNKGYLGGGGGKERLRQRFVACALWLGALRTGEDGVIRAKFTAPDGLTRYRLIAIAHTASSQFGKSTSNFSVSKPLMVEPVLPRFANVSDNIQARALVLNESGKPGRITASLALDDKATSENGTNLTATLEVPAGSSAIASFAVTLAKVGEAKWTWRVAFAEDPSGFSDAVLSTLFVGSPLPVLRESAFIRADVPATNLLGGFNPQLLEGTGEVRVRLSNTRLVLLGEPMRHLLTYPYGCAEQTSSSTLPWVVLRQSPELLPLVEKSAAEANAALEAGVARLLKMQTRSGGLAYWAGGSEPALWASTYGAMVLGLARGAGTVVPETQWDELLAYLSGELRKPGNSQEDQCLALYALALGQKAEPAYHTKLFEKRAQLSASSRAALALAIAASGGNDRMISELLVWEAQKPRAEARPFESDARTDAMWLLALMRTSTGAAETVKVFDRLMGIQENGHWGTTQGNAWALLALSTYLNAADGKSVPGKALLARGDARQTIEFTPEQRLANRVLEFGPEMARVPLMLQKEGAGPLFAQVTLESRVSGATKVAQNHGFGLERHYAKLTDDNKPSTDRALRVGDRVLVTLKIAVPQQANYVALDDPLPAVLEAINPNFKTQENAAKPGMSDWNGESGYERLPMDFQELRQDRVLFFANWVSKGNYLVQYVARVRGVGTVTAPAARIEEMYRPGRFGLSASEVMRAE